MLAEDAVLRKPVSTANSLRTGKNTGKFRATSESEHYSRPKSICEIGIFRAKFRTPRTGKVWRYNRENSFDRREFSSPLPPYPTFASAGGNRSSKDFLPHHGNAQDRRRIVGTFAASCR